MSASWPGNMRSPRVKTPLLLLLLLLLTALTRTVHCQDEYDNPDPEPEIPVEEAEPEVEAEPEPEPEPEVDPGAEDPETPEETDASTTELTPTEPTNIDSVNESTEEHGSGEDKKQSRSLDIYGDITPTSSEYTVTSTAGPEDLEGLGLIIIVIPVVLVVVIIGMIVGGIFINRRWNQKVRNPDLTKEDPYLDGSSTEKVPMPMFEEDVPSVLELEMEELDQWMKKDSESAEDSQHA